VDNYGNSYPDISTKKPRTQSDAELAKVQTIMREFSQLQIWRNNFATQWEEISELVLPTSRNTFMYNSYNTPGMKKTQQQVDATGMMALSRFSAILSSLLTPSNSMWHTLEADDDYVMKDRATQLWFERTNKKLFKLRYSPMGNFEAQNQQIFQSLGAFGTGVLFMDKFIGMHGERAIRYKGVPLGEMFLRENHQGLVDGFIRWYRLTAEQAFQKWPDTFPEILRTQLEAKSQMPCNFLHYVMPRGDDYDPAALDHRAMKWQSCQLSIEGLCILEEGGYNTLPIAATRYEQTPGEIYGRSPAMMVLPALKTLNAEKRTFLTQGHRAANPVYLVNDDGITSPSMRPGAFNAGGVTSDGKPLVHMLPTGDIQISKEMMQEEKSLINDANLVSLFQILTESPQMTATETLERVKEKGILLAPSVGRQNSEYLGNVIPRELSLMAQMQLLDPMPPRLREANGAYNVVFTSPMAQMMKTATVAGFWRTVDQAKDIFTVTQDPAVFDDLNISMGIKATAEANGVVPSMMASDDEKQQKVSARTKAQKEEQAIRAAPAKAALNSSMAKQAQAGMQVPGGPGQPPVQQ
jgi:Bacteriophage head to tail connecting protein